MRSRYSAEVEKAKADWRGVDIAAPPNDVAARLQRAAAVEPAPCGATRVSALRTSLQLKQTVSTVMDVQLSCTPTDRLT